MPENENAPPGREPGVHIGVAGWLAVAVLAAFLVGAIAYAAYGWNSLSDVSMPLSGWLYMTLGIVVTFAVGAGLMALIFYSSRKGRDF